MNALSLTYSRLLRFALNNVISGSEILFITDIDGSFQELIRQMSDERIEIIPDADYMILYNLQGPEQSAWIALLIERNQPFMVFSPDLDLKAIYPEETEAEEVEKTEDVLNTKENEDE